jgi:hypothetical protein
MVTTRHIRIGAIILLIAVSLVLFAAIYWQQTIHVNTFLRMLADDPLYIIIGC